MRLADIVEVLHATELFKLAGNWVSRFMSLLSGVLFLEHFDALIFFESFKLLWEHLQEGVQDFTIVYLLHTLETEDARSWVLVIDHQHACHCGKDLILLHAVSWAIDSHEDEVFLEVGI